MQYNRRQEYTDKGEPIVWQSADGNLRVVARPDDHSYDPEDFYGELSEEDISSIQTQIDTFGMWVIFLEEQDTDGDWDWLDNIGGVIPDDDYTLLEAAQEHFLLDKYKPLGLFNWNKQNYKTRFAETFAASRRKRKPLNQTGVFNWWDETALWALKYDWVKLILLENPEKSPYEIMRTTRNDTRKCPSCATRRYSANRENYGAMVEHYNNGWKKFIYDSCNCDPIDTSAEKRRQKEVQKEMLRRGLVVDMDKVHPDIQPAAAKWYLKKGKRNTPIPYWFHREYSHPTFFQRLRKRFTHRRGYSDWMVREREKYMSENFSAPFMDVTFQDTPIQVKHLYHGQHTVDGVEITPHSPYWTPDLGLALGHALFGAEQEVTGADFLICSKCDGTHTTSEGDMCYSCDEEGYVLQETFTDEILPQTTPIVLSLDFTEPQTVYFKQDIEHDEGLSYLVESEKFRWSFVPADTLLALLYTWLDTGLPELVEFDTGAGYVSDESSVTDRIKQAIHQLEQSAH